MRLTEQGQGVVLEDIMFYAMPLGWLGAILKQLLIADRLDRIFAVRRDYIKAKWVSDD